MHINVKYLTIEDVSSGLFQTQVIDIIKEICLQESNLNFEIIVVNRPWYFFKHQKVLHGLKDQFSNYNLKIKIKYLPFLPPLRNAQGSYIYSIFVSNWLSLLFKIFINKNFSIIHCRSYWPTIAAINVFKKPIIFDMRSLWPAENLSNESIKKGSLAERYWYSVEKKLLKRSIFSTCVSQGMLNYANAIASTSKTKLIPISVDFNKFNSKLSNREYFRNKLSWNNNIVLVYSGSFGMEGINFKELKLFIQLILNKDTRLRLLFVTMESDENVEYLMSFCKNKDVYKVVHPKHDQIGDWVSCGDIGIHALPKQIDSKTRLGTKIVEYWACGLPVIINCNIGSAVDLIKSNSFLGKVIDSSIELDILFIDDILKFDKNLISKFAFDNFSTNNIAKSYIEIYNQCL